jgi:hypothetical protein
MAPLVDRLLGERHVHHRETWTSTLGREALVAELRDRLTLLGGAVEVEGPSRLTARSGSFRATARTPNARWPMRWSFELADADPAVVTIDVVDALPAGFRPGSQRLYLAAIRKATEGLRRDLAAAPLP